MKYTKILPLLAIVGTTAVGHGFELQEKEKLEIAKHSQMLTQEFMNMADPDSGQVDLVSVLQGVKSYTKSFPVRDGGCGSESKTVSTGSEKDCGDCNGESKEVVKTVSVKAEKDCDNCGDCDSKTVAKSEKQNSAASSRAKQLSEKMVKLFKSMDSNNDFNLSKEELEVGFNAYMVEETHKRFSSDGNKDRLVTLEEYSLGFPSATNGKESNKSATRHFKMIDADSNGYIDADETIASRGNFTMRSVSGFFISRELIKLDANANDILEHAEIKDVMPESFSSKRGIKKGELFFSILFMNEKERETVSANLTGLNIGALK